MLMLEIGISGSWSALVFSVRCPTGGVQYVINVSWWTHWPRLKQHCIHFQWWRKSGSAAGQMVLQSESGSGGICQQGVVNHQLWSEGRLVTQSGNRMIILTCVLLLLVCLFVCFCAFSNWQERVRYRVWDSCKSLQDMYTPLHTYTHAAERELDQEVWVRDGPVFCCCPPPKRH